MEIKDKGNIIKVDNTCYIEVLTTRMFDEENKRIGSPIVFLNKHIKYEDSAEVEIPMIFSPKQAIQLGNLLRECGKEAYAQRFDKD